MITDSEVISDRKQLQPDKVGVRWKPATCAQHSPRASACAVFRDTIEVGLSSGRNAMAIWQDLVDEYGFTNSYQSVQRFVRKLRGAQKPEARAVIVTAPGQDAQVDYGTGPMVRDPKTGKYRRTRLFDDPGLQSQVGSPADVSLQGFRRLGGTTRLVVYDFVPGNKIELMCLIALCGRGGLNPRQLGCAVKGRHIMA